MDIKNLKPHKNSRYHLGMIDPSLCKKYFSDCINEPIIYRSGLEKLFIEYCEDCPGITRWASEPLKIKYISRLDKREHTYYPDYVIQNSKGDRTIVEIKPYALTQQPSESASLYDKKMWIRNVDKWRAAKIFAEQNNMKFVIITEKSMILD